VADVNGDGKPDLATANASSNTVGVLLGQGQRQLLIARARTALFIGVRAPARECMAIPADRSSGPSDGLYEMHALERAHYLLRKNQ
jgi:hypothetical protein